MQTEESLKLYELISDDEAETGIRQAIALIRKQLPVFTEKFPAASSVNYFYPSTENDDWTNGFWTGELWLAYEHTGDAMFKDAALKQVMSFEKRIIDRVVVDHHDMGFLYSLSCVAAYKLVKDETAKHAALMAADNLLGRFQEKGEFFQAWGTLGARDNYRLIIDCFMNLPLLFWATQVTGDAIYADLAKKHIKTAVSCLIRKDSSTYHTFYFDPNTGVPLKGASAQGYADHSAWSRGQAWGIYGMALCYSQLKEKQHLVIFDDLLAYFISHLPDDLVPYWDFTFTDGSREPRDSSAAVIAVCGLLEMARHVDKDRADYYIGLARKIMKLLVTNYAVKDQRTAGGLLLHGTYAKHSPHNTVKDAGVDECTIWGDYFYMEALIRLTRDWNSYW